MPIYMDRHDVSEEVTAENVAQLHQEDLKIQDEFNCRGLTYWFDDQRKTAFCLVEAPDAESVHRMHDHAHGEIPHSIIEVDPNLVELFLGRIEDPKALSGSEMKVIDEPGFRTLFVAKIEFNQIDHEQLNQLAHDIQEYKRKICKVIESYNGKIVYQNGYAILTSFVSTKDAVNCADFVSQTLRNEYPYMTFSIGLDSGNPVSSKKSIFEETIKSSKRLCNLKSNVAISYAVYKTYNDEGFDLPLNKKRFKLISPSEMIFLYKLLDFLDDNFGRSELRIESIAIKLGYSKSQFYRKTINLTGKSPIHFLNKFRLDKSLDFLKDGLTSTSEAAFLCGFSSPSYFSRRFAKRYGIPPTGYIRAIGV